MSTAIADWPKFLAKLKGREEVAEHTMAFRFEKPANFKFIPGQFIDMTLLNPSETDPEGNTRGFSIAHGRRDGHDLQNWYRAESQFLQSVPLEIVETNHGITVRAHITGFTDKQVELRVGSHRLVISGRKQLFDHRSRDVRPTEICRILDLRAEIEPSKVTATFIEGGLEITLPKVVAGRNGPTARKAA